MMKQKILVLLVLIFVASASSVAVLASEGYFSSKEIENKVLASEQLVEKPIVLAQSTTDTKKPTITKTQKAPVKKVVAKKKKTTAKKKSKLNLAPPVFTPETAPFSAKNKSN